MTLEQRIEAAAKRACMYDWETATTIERGLLKIQAASWFKYLCPELFTDPPTGWIAPWTMDPRCFSTQDECGDCGADLGGELGWVSVRDEFLSRHPMKPTEAKE